MAKIIIPTPLRKFTNNESTFETTGATVNEAVAELVGTHTNLEKHLLDDDKNVRSFIRVYLGEEDVNLLKEKGDTEVAANDIISIVPAIAGGSQ